MPDTKELTEYINRRLKAIQRKYNFDPLVGVKQIATKPEISVPYGRFRELVKMAKKWDLQARILYDPTATGHAKLREFKRPTKLYFFRRCDNEDVYKIGWSTNPHLRLGSVQTGNDGPLKIAAVFPGGRALETKLKFRLRKYKTRDLNKFYKGEWYNIPKNILIPFLKALKEELRDEEKKSESG
jgi:hypothetical protein